MALLGFIALVLQSLCLFPPVLCLCNEVWLLRSYGGAFSLLGRCHGFSDTSDNRVFYALSESPNEYLVIQLLTQMLL